MRIDLCRCCGAEQEIKQKCHLCREGVQYECTKCRTTTDTQHHLQCNLISFDYHLLNVTA